METKFNPKIIDNVSCVHKDIYQKQQKFCFLPGHRALLLELPGLVPKYVKPIEAESSANDPRNDLSNHEAFSSSSILKEMINTAVKKLWKNTKQSSIFQNVD